MFYLIAVENVVSSTRIKRKMYYKGTEGDWAAQWMPWLGYAWNDRGIVVRFPAEQESFIFSEPPDRLWRRSIHLFSRHRRLLRAKLTAYLHLVSRLRMRGIIPSLPLTCLWRGIFAQVQLYFWKYVLLAVIPYGLVGIYRRFRGPCYCCCHPDDRGSKLFWNIDFCYQATCHIPEDIFMVTAGPRFFCCCILTVDWIKFSFMGVHVRGTTVFWNLLYYEQIHLENMNYDISLFRSLEFGMTLWVLNWVLMCKGIHYY
jgi:hypothetical protein